MYPKDNWCGMVFDWSYCCYGLLLQRYSFLGHGPERAIRHGMILAKRPLHGKDCITTNEIRVKLSRRLFLALSRWVPSYMANSGI
jgi:hypothetical protein